MRSSKSTSAKTTSTVAIFIGGLLIVIFGVGLTAVSRSDTFMQNHRYDFAMRQIIDVCKAIWLPAGIIGIPLFLFSLIRSLIQESRENRESR